MYNIITKTAARTAYNLSLKHSLMILIVGIFLLPKIASASPVLPEILIELTNVERRKNNLNTLTINPLLVRAAEAKAKAILASGKFEHNINDRRFSSWIKEAGYEYSYVGENLAIDFETSEGIFEAWMDSESHKTNILNDCFQEIGIALIEGEYRGEKTVVVAQIFGTALSVVPLKRAEKDKPETISLQAQKYASKSYYILSAGAKNSLSVIIKTISVIKSNLASKSGISELWMQSFRLASMVFFTISILLFYIYSTLHLFIFSSRHQLDESEIIC